MQIKKSGPNPGDDPKKVPTETREKPSLFIPWGELPWWAVIVVIVGVLVGFSMLTNVKYIDALTFILDLPWHKEELQDATIADNGEWIITSRPHLDPGKYTLYVEFWDEDDNVIGQTETFFIEVSSVAVEGESPPITEPKPDGEYLVIDQTRPTIKGTSEIGLEAVLFDDFSKKPLRLIENLWKSEGLFLTIRVTIISFACALVLGLLFGLMRVSKRSPDLRKNLVIRLVIGAVLFILALVLDSLPQDTWKIVLTFIGIEAFMLLLPAIPYTFSTLYVEVMRGLPMLVIVLYMGFAVTPAIRDASGNWAIGELDLRGIPSAIIGLSIGYGAYLAEVFRGGIESIHKGQMEAARSLGMSYIQAMRYVILPQAFRVILPPLGNDFIALLKDSSLISVIALPELLQRGRLWISRTFRAFEGYNSVALLYLIMTLVLSMLVRFIERRSSID
jgi:ABC-type amino acid transport system permease subunit